MTDEEATRWVELEPVDAWFFREARPSNRGEDQSDLESLFPPHAPTVVGAIRAALARQQGWSGRGDWPDTIKNVLGDGFEDLGRLRFTGPFLRRCSELIFPMPRHVLGRTEQDDRGRARFVPSGWLIPSQDPIETDAGSVRLPVPRAPAKADETPAAPADGFFVTYSGLQGILEGRLPEAEQCVHPERLFTHEPRVGIAFDTERPATRTTGEGSIYSPSYVRLAKGVSLVMGIQGLPGGRALPGMFPLGGESRLAACRELRPDAVRLPGAVPGGRSLLILLTPARLGNADGQDWFGAGPDESAARLQEGASGRVVTVSIDRPVRIGGWDSMRRRPRSLEPFVPAGSVWWLEGEGVTGGQTMRLGNGPYTAYGFGQAVCGRWPNGARGKQEAHHWKRERN